MYFLLLISCAFKITATRAHAVFNTHFILYLFLRCVLVNHITLCRCHCNVNKWPLRTLFPFLRWILPTPFDDDVDTSFVSSICLRYCLQFNYFWIISYFSKWMRSIQLMMNFHIIFGFVNVYWFWWNKVGNWRLIKIIVCA